MDKKTEIKKEKDNNPENSSKYKIFPVKIDKKKHPKWENVEEFLPGGDGTGSFAILSQAPPKSGKSCWCLNMLLSPKFDWINRFDRIVIISPTIFSDKTMAPIHKVIDPEIPDNPYADKVKLFDDIDSIDLIINSLLEEQKENLEVKTLLIIDDAIGTMKTGLLGKTMAKYRHYNLSILAISQVWKGFCPISRASANGYVLWKTFNTKERDKVIQELSGIPGIEQMYDDVTSKKHSFLWVNLENMSVWDNFDRCLWKK